MDCNIQFVNKLPKINHQDSILVLESAKDTLAQDWLSYVERIVDISIKCKPDDIKFKLVRENFAKTNDISKFDEDVKNQLGIGNIFSVIDFFVQDDQIEVKALKTYEELVSLYRGKRDPVADKKYVRRSIIDRFFAFMWSNKKLMYPIGYKTPNYQRSGDWKELVSLNPITDMLEKRFAKKEGDQAKMYQKLVIYSLIVCTNWYEPEAIIEEDLAYLERGIENSSDLSIKTKKYYILVFNELRYALINSGRDDIVKPRDRARQKKERYSKKRRSLNWVDIEKYPNLSKIVFMAVEFPDKLKRDGLAVGTIDSSMTAIANFLEYLITYYSNSEITIEAVDSMFDPKNEFNLHSHIKLNKKEATVQGEMSTIIKFLVYCELYSSKAKKNTPVTRRRKSTKPYRSAMPRKMVQHIVDIIKNRPPNSTTRWIKEESDNSWWKHDVYPVYPIMMLFEYYIPLRGEQVRNLCREKSFVFGADGKIDTIVINTDKNVNRKYLQEIPCVWDDLQIFVPFLKWHKRYFKHIPKVMYHNDENSPWEEIEPLFITPQVLRPLSRQTHSDYHKKILCQYQLEVMEEAKKNGNKDYPVVAWAKKGKKFFKDIEELNNCSSNRMKDIEVMYDLHSLRVTGATRYLESGVGLNLVMLLTGHATPDTLIRIYINMTQKEKKQKLRSAINKIYFGNPDELIKSSSDLLCGELTDAYEKGKETLSAVLEDNELFSLKRKVSVGSTEKEFELGSSIALNYHPSTWFPMIHGICPAVKCPEGRERKCSLCPYLITGKLFINGIMLKVNQDIAKFQRKSIEKHEEEQKGYKNQALAEYLEVLLEEILAWWEIIRKIEDGLTKEDHDSSGTNIVKKETEPKFISKMLSTDMEYLENAYDAKMIGVEQDRMGLKILTIKAMKIAIANKDMEKVDLLSNNEEEAIDYLMQYYQGKSLEGKNVEDFVHLINAPKSNINL